MIAINYRDARPIYVQIKDSFRRLIVTGAMENGQKLPSVRELASELAINPNTIQRAYRELESEGYVCSLAGKGSFVSYEKKQPSASIAEKIEHFQHIASQLLALEISESELHAMITDLAQRRIYHD